MPAPPAVLQVLVVDDDPQACFILQAMLKRDGHAVELATCAATGMEVLAQRGPDTFDAVISDYWMPGGNGLELIKQVRSLDPTLSVLLATAAGEAEIVAEVLRHGGVGYLTKPVSGSALREAVLKAALTTREQRELRATAAGASALGDSQRFLLQHHLAQLGDSVELFFHSQAEASGDFISVLPVNDHQHIILFSDASGHDLRAAFQSNYFHGIARGMALRGARIEEVFHHFNELLLSDWNADGDVQLSLAACSLVLDRAAQSVHSINCGMPFPLVCDAEGFAYPLQVSQGTGPLGWFPDQFNAVYTPLPTGLVVIWTDGLPDLADQLDIDPLALTHRLLRRDAASDFYLANATDDLAVIRINLAHYSRRETAPALPLISHRFAGDTAPAIDHHQDWLDRSLRVALPELADDRLADITICAREAILNALNHGCGGRQDKFADVQVSLSASGDQLHLRVTDGGEGHDFDLERHEPTAAADLLTEHRGLMMMKHLPARTAAFSRGACMTMDFPV